jgi:hypothetical protein
MVLGLRTPHSGYPRFSHDAVIRVYDAAGNVIETHEQAGDFKVWQCVLVTVPNYSGFLVDLLRLVHGEQTGVSNPLL